MSRIQSSLPLKSNALRMPVPVITHTFVPSVTGDGVDMFCLRWRLSPSLRCCFQIGSPLLRSTAHRNRLPFSATLRKMRSPHTIGVDPDNSGIGSRQAIFSVVDHFTGRFVSGLMPFSDGPLH